MCKQQPPQTGATHPLWRQWRLDGENGATTDPGHTAVCPLSPFVVADLGGRHGCNGRPHRLSETTCLDNKQLGFSLGEPAVNVYTEGGGFDPHQDRQSLTVLIPLSDPEAFDGGGTAFWAAADCTSSGVGSSAPFLVLKPQAGTGVVFGSSVFHAGQRISAGERCGLVASFIPADEPLPDDPVERCP